MLVAAKIIMAHIAKRGGGVYDLRGKPVRKNYGWEVAPFQVGLRVKFLKQDTPLHVATWLEAISGGVMYYHIGSYVYNGLLYLDATITCYTELEAIHLARGAGERVIWDWGRKDHIAVTTTPREVIYK